MHSHWRALVSRTEKPKFWRWLSAVSMWAPVCSYLHNYTVVPIDLQLILGADAKHHLDMAVMRGPLIGGRPTRRACHPRRTTWCHGFHTLHDTEIWNTRKAVIAEIQLHKAHEQTVKSGVYNSLAHRISTPSIKTWFDQSFQLFMGPACEIWIKIQNFSFQKMHWRFKHVVCKIFQNMIKKLYEYGFDMSPKTNTGDPFHSLIHIFQVDCTVTAALFDCSSASD